MYKYLLVLKSTGEPIVYADNRNDLEKLVWDLPNGNSKWKIVENNTATQ